MIAVLALVLAIATATAAATLDAAGNATATAAGNATATTTATTTVTTTTTRIATAAAVDTTGTAAPPDSTDAVFLTFESGTLAAVDWVERRGNRLHTRSELTQSRVIDATIDLRNDESVAHSSSVLIAAGDAAPPPVERVPPQGTVYWSDMVASSIEQAVLRARAIDRWPARVPAASLFTDSHGEIEVERVDSTDCVVRYHNKGYEVLTDSRGRMLAATLPEYGITIERRDAFAPDRYPLSPPNASPPDATYTARDVRIPAPQGHVLAGTLTTPPGRARAPAAVLVTGLGANNRNNGVPPWMPLKDFADCLTRRGIIVLRVDDRGVGESTGDRASSTTFDEADDVRTEVAWLRARSDVDPKRIAIVGYSEGGLIAPMVAASDSTIAAIVTLAGPGVPGLEVGRYQLEAAIDADTTIAVANREREIQKQLTEGLTVRESTYLGIEPLQYSRRVRCPALIVQGGRDRHVPLRSAERMAAAMRSNGNLDVTVRLFPGVSHALLPDPGGLSNGWVMLPGFLTAPEIMHTVAEWMEVRLGVGHAVARGRGVK